MEKRKTPLGLKVLFVVTFIFLALFAGSFVYFGFTGQGGPDADIDGPLAALLHSFDVFKDIATFSFNGMPNVIYYVICGFAYGVAGLVLIFLIIGIAIGASKKRAVVVPAIIASLFMVFVGYLIVAIFDKFWAIVNQHAPFDGDNSLILPVALVYGTAAIYIILAIVAFLKAAADAVRYPGLNKNEAFESNVNEEKPQEANEPEKAQEEVAEFETIIEEPAPEFVPTSEVEEIKEEPAIEEEPPVEEEPVVEEEQKAEDKDDLKAMLKEIVRDIVRDEIARNNANQARGGFDPMNGGTVTGATFGGPLVVQYFNGGINSPAPAPQEVKAEPVPQPVQEKPVEEKPVEEKVEEACVCEKCEEELAEEEPVQEEVEVVEEPIEEQPVEEEPIPEVVPNEVVEEPVPERPVEEPAPEAEPKEKKPIIRIPFTERMINADDEMKKNYNELKNEILSYGVNSRVSNSGDTFRLHCKTYVKITIAGLSLKIYFALDPEQYKDSTLPVQNAGHKGIYAEIPLVFKVRSSLSMRRCKQLIQDVMEKDGLEQSEVKDIDWVEELKIVSQEEEAEEN